MHHTWLRSFHAVAQAGGFTKGANAIGVGQPTVTAQVKLLEETFNVELFHRIGKSARLTATGEALYRITRPLFGYQQEALDFLRRAGRPEAETLRLGAANPNGIMPLIKAVRDAAPEIELSIMIAERDDLLRRLLDFELDIAAIGLPPNDPKFLTAFYRRLRVHVEVAEDHPWATRREIHISELDDQPMILREPESTTRRAFEAAAKAAGITVRTEMEINNREAIREAVALGLGFGVGAEVEFGGHGKLRWLPVRGANMHIELNLTCLAQRRDRPSIHRFFEIAEANRDNEVETLPTPSATSSSARDAAADQNL